MLHYEHLSALVANIYFIIYAYTGPVGGIFFRPYLQPQTPANKCPNYRRGKPPGLSDSVRELRPVLPYVMKSPADGAKTSVLLATEDLGKLSGRYWQDLTQGRCRFVGVAVPGC